MKQFTNRILLCTLPVVISAIIVGLAVRSYLHGEGGFKLGVDLAGGTVLIYEVEQPEDGKSIKIQDVAAALKRRIDPADLYNVTIRPSGTDRVEIILPTGGKVQIDVQEKQWRNLVDQVQEVYKPKSYSVPLGRVMDLVAEVYGAVPKDEKVTPAEIEKYISERYKPGSDPEANKKAWEALLTEIAAKWKPSKYEVGRGRYQVLVNKVRDQYPDLSPRELGLFIELLSYKQSLNGGKVDAAELDSIRAAIDRTSGKVKPTDQEIRDDQLLIDLARKTGKSKRYMGAEEVQQIKEKIAAVGSLEFRIIANSTDDSEAMDAARKYIEDPAHRQELEALAVAGKSPPKPVNADGSQLFEAANNLGKYTYSWVELGKLYRSDLGLANAQRATSPLWSEFAQARADDDGKDAKPGEKKIRCVSHGGNLFYSRKVTNPRVNDKEASKQLEYFVLMRDPEPDQEITGQELAGARVAMDRQGGIAVGFSFKTKGSNRFFNLTSKNSSVVGGSDSGFKRQLGILLDGKLETAPTINQAISGDGIIESRSFTKEAVDRYVDLLRTGQLPATLRPDPVSESTMGPTLGQDTIEWGSRSVILAFLAVLVFMIIYYRFAGLVASVALLANLLITVAFMVLVNATFTLPGLAGLVLTLGMAVDANVLIYERLREERERGASLSTALRNGYDRAFPTIIDTHLSSIFTAIVLYAVGNDQLKGFGISLTAGLIISLFTSLVMTRLIFDFWHAKGWLTQLSMMKLLAKPNYNFMAIRKVMFATTVALTVIGAVVFVLRLDRGGLNIDFVGGTAYGGQLTQSMDIASLRKDIEKSGLPDLSVETIFSQSFSDGDKSKLFTVRTSEKNQEQVQEKINKSLGDKLKKTLLGSWDMVATPIVMGDKKEERVKEATLAFADASGSPDFASRSQVSLLLSNVFRATPGLGSLAEQFAVEGIGPESDGRFAWMKLTLTQAVTKEQLQKVLAEVKQKLSDLPQPERLDVFDSQLAAETQRRALYAILTSWAAILLYLWFRFGNWTFGLAAVICLIHDLFFTLGAIALCHFLHEIPLISNVLLIQDFKIDLPAVAALLTLVGYSVNDTIVVFDRIREVRGKNPQLTFQMINDSVNQTLSRTVLASFTTFLVVFVLYLFGGDGVHLFAFVMVVGVVVGTYSSIYIASPLLIVFGEGVPKTESEKQAALRQEAALTQR